MLEDNTNVKMLPCVNYFDFMKLLKNSVYVITDGGSNQKELYYMGKPCLILRNRSEREEGLGINAKLYEGDTENVMKFSMNYDKNYVEKPEVQMSPSTMIVSVFNK